MELQALALVLFFVSLGGLVKGLTGFGFGILGTALLANFISVQDAVTVMILPLLAVNIPLILEADLSELKNCIQNYGYFISAGLLGAFIGVLIVDYLPVEILSIGIGLIAVLYVYFKQDYFYSPEKQFSQGFTDKSYNQSIIGSTAGIVFGASNIGLLYVTYLDRLELSKKTFAGLLSVVILSAALIRMTVSMSTGLYTSQLFMISGLAALVGLVVSEAGAKISYRVPEKFLQNLTLLLILVAGLRILIINL